MKISTKIKIYALAGERIDGEVFLNIENVQNENRMVALQWGEGNRITVVAEELRLAIMNAINHP